MSISFFKLYNFSIKIWYKNRDNKYLVARHTGQLPERFRNYLHLAKYKRECCSRGGVGCRANRGDFSIHRDFAIIGRRYRGYSPLSHRIPQLTSSIYSVTRRRATRTAFCPFPLLLCLEPLLIGGQAARRRAIIRPVFRVHDVSRANLLRRLSCITVGRRRIDPVLHFFTLLQHFHRSCIRPTRNINYPRGI